MTDPSRVAKTQADQTAGEDKSELLKVVVQALLIALVVRTFLFQPFNIPSGSLIPTLLVGDYIFVSKYSYGFSRFSLPLGDKFAFLPQGRILGAEPKRGDIAVFKLPSDPSTDYIKRVIGLPGDHIQMRAGILYVNDQPLKKDLVGTRESDVGANYSGRTSYYRETLPNGVSYTIQEEDVFGNRLSQDTGVYQVPPGNFFMMGDNRTNSLDSRVPSPQGVGYVPFDNFVGRAEVIFFSVKDPYSFWQFWYWPWSVRTDRLFTPIR